jgi:hypothetical protein
MLWIVPVRIEAEAMAEAGIATELILANAFDELDQPVMNRARAIPNPTIRRTIL